MSLDDYYIDRDKISPGPDGKIDLEHINTIDTELFCQQISALLRGEEVGIPTFSFKLGKRVWTGHKLKLDENSVIIVNDNLIITHRVIEDGKPKYYGIRDKVLRSEDDDRIYVVGYIAKVISE
jgi:uridine kinase